jgi:spermidine synthase
MSCNEPFFTEEQTPNLRLSLRIREQCVVQQTRYQKLELYETEEFGKLLALDGKVMLTERDERFYHEMLVHPAMLTHPNPERVLIIGGGDGGTAREVLRHPSVKEVIWSEIDEAVVEVARRFLPSVCENVFEDERVRLHIVPGEELVRSLAAEIDVILVDSTDPIGPAVALFTPPFFAACRRTLRQSGIYAMQCGSPFLFQNEGRAVVHHLSEMFTDVRRYLGFVPTYPSGLWSYVTASGEPLDLSLDELAHRFAERSLKLSYYTPEVHLASGVVPPALR